MQTLVIIGIVWATALGLWLAIDLALVVVLLLMAATLPLLLDYLRAAQQHLGVHPDALRWSNGRSDGSVALEAGTTVSLRRRFDGGLRIIVTGPEGETRLPVDLAPPLAPLEAALQQTPATVRRDPFRLI